MAKQTKIKKTAASRKRREKKNIERGAAHIRSSFNNTLVTITDLQGNAISWSSSGSLSASSAPLYIVDGAPYEAGIANINPQDIESITSY